MLVKTDPIQKIILIIIIIIIIIIIKSQGKIAAAFYVFVGVMGFPKQNTTFFPFLFKSIRVLGLDARLLRGQVHIGDGGHQGDKTVRGSAVDRPPDQGHPLLHAARRQASLCIVVPALLDGHAELGQALHIGGERERTALSVALSQDKHGGQANLRLFLRLRQSPLVPTPADGQLAGARGTLQESGCLPSRQLPS